MCHPQFDWGKCSEQVEYRNFFLATSCVHFFVLISYSIISIVVSNSSRTLRRKGDINCRLKLADWMRLSIVLYSLFGLLHNISLIFSEPLFHPLPTLLFYNMYALGMLITLLLIVKYWIGLAKLIAGDLHVDVSSLVTGGNKFSDTFITYISALNLAVLILLVTLTYHYREDTNTVNILLTMEAIWHSVNSLAIGIAMTIFGSKVTTALSKSKSEESSKLYPRFKFLYLFFVTVGPFYCAVHVISIIFNIWYMSLNAWYVIYGFFNIAGLLIAASFLPLLARKSTEGQGFSSSGVVNSVNVK